MFSLLELFYELLSCHLVDAIITLSLINHHTKHTLFPLHKIYKITGGVIDEIIRILSTIWASRIKTSSLLKMEMIK